MLVISLSLNPSRLEPGLIRFIGLSPIIIDEFRLDEKKGIVFNGKIKTDVPLIKGAEIDLSVEGKNFMLSKDFNLGEVKGLPGPFKVTDVSLKVFASTSKGLGAEGNLDFEIPRIGKGRMTGLASTGEGFGISGSFEFDSTLFKSKITASYINEKFSFEGDATLSKGKLKGVDLLNFNVSYSKTGLSGSGRAKLSIPGVKEIVINVAVTPEGDFTLTGDVEFGNIKKLQTGEAKAKLVISRKAGDWEIGFSGSLKPNIDVAGFQIKEVNISFIKGVFDVSAKAHFQKGKLNGDIGAGVTNATITPDGKKGDSPEKELNFYADGVLKMEITKGVEIELKVQTRPGSPTASCKP